MAMGAGTADTLPVMAWHAVAGRSGSGQPPPLASPPNVNDEACLLTPVCLSVPVVPADSVGQCRHRDSR